MQGCICCRNTGRHADERGRLDDGHRRVNDTTSVTAPCDRAGQLGMHPQAWQRPRDAWPGERQVHQDRGDVQQWQAVDHEG